MAVPTDSAGQYPCGWCGTQSWKGGETLTLVTAKRSASTKASTAALSPFSQRLLLLQPCVSCHPASGQKWQERNRRRAGSQEGREKRCLVPSEALIGRTARSLSKTDPLYRMLVDSLGEACAAR